MILHLTCLCHNFHSFDFCEFNTTKILRHPFPSSQPLPLPYNGQDHQHPKPSTTMPPTLLLIRHAEAFHNLTNKSPPFTSPHLLPLLTPNPQNWDLPDPVLTPTGEEQCYKLYQHLKKQPLARKIELVVCSPMRRTLQTMLLGLDDVLGRGVEVLLDGGWQG
jgi:hypothetical protein